MKESVDPFRDWDAAYVLGALSPDDRRDFERHLTTCLSCSAAVGELAGLPGILTNIDAHTAVSIKDTPLESPLDSAGSVQKLATQARRRQQRFRRGVIASMASAAALLLVVGIFTGKAIGPSTQLATGTSTGTVVAMSQVQKSSMSASLRVTSKPWGTRFDWSCDYGNAWAPSSSTQAYDLVVTDRSGVESTIATWKATGPGAAGLSASSSIPIDNIRSIDIREAGSIKALVRGEI